MWNLLTSKNPGIGHRWISSCKSQMCFKVENPCAIIILGWCQLFFTNLGWKKKEKEKLNADTTTLNHKYKFWCIQNLCFNHQCSSVEGVEKKQ